MMANRLSRTSLELWFGWVVVNTIGGAIGSFSGEALSSLYSNSIVSFFLLGLGIGIPTSLFQGVFLASQIPKTLTWILVSSLSLVLCITFSPFLILLACAVTGGIGGESACFGVFGLFTGCVVGIMQWLFVLRKLPKSMQWILFSSIGSAIGLGLGDAVALSQGGKIFTFSTASISGLILMGTIARCINGAITGIALVQILQGHRQRKLSN